MSDRSTSSSSSFSSTGSATSSLPAPAGGRPEQHFWENLSSEEQFLCHLTIGASIFCLVFSTWAFIIYVKYRSYFHPGIGGSPVLDCLVATFALSILCAINFFVSAVLHLAGKLEGYCPMSAFFVQAFFVPESVLEGAFFVVVALEASTRRFTQRMFRGVLAVCLLLGFVFGFVPLLVLDQQPNGTQFGAGMPWCWIPDADQYYDDQASPSFSKSGGSFPASMTAAAPMRNLFEDSQESRGSSSSLPPPAPSSSLKLRLVRLLCGFFWPYASVVVGVISFVYFFRQLRRLSRTVSKDIRLRFAYFLFFAVAWSIFFIHRMFSSQLSAATATTLTRMQAVIEPALGGINAVIFMLTERVWQLRDVKDAVESYRAYCRQKVKELAAASPDGDTGSPTARVAGSGGASPHPSREDSTILLTTASSSLIIGSASRQCSSTQVAAAHDQHSADSSSVTASLLPCFGDSSHFQTKEGEGSGVKREETKEEKRKTPRGRRTPHLSMDEIEGEVHELQRCHTLSSVVDEERIAAVVLSTQPDDDDESDGDDECAAESTGKGKGDERKRIYTAGGGGEEGYGSLEERGRTVTTTTTSASALAVQSSSDHFHTTQRITGRLEALCDGQQSWLVCDEEGEPLLALVPAPPSTGTGSDELVGALLSPLPPRPKTALVVMMALVAGYCDATGFLTLRLFPAHMTANLLFVVAALCNPTPQNRMTGDGEDSWTFALSSRVAVLPLLAYLVFLAVCGIAQGTANHWRHHRRLCFVAEIVLLAAAFLSSHFGSPLLVSKTNSAGALGAGLALTAAMSIQNVVQRLYLPGCPVTTNLTGNSVQFVSDIISLCRSSALARHHASPQWNTTMIKGRIGRTALTLFSFLVGVLVASLLDFHGASHWLYLPGPFLVVAMLLIFWTDFQPPSPNSA